MGYESERHREARIGFYCIVLIWLTFMLLVGEPDLMDAIKARLMDGVSCN